MYVLSQSHTFKDRFFGQKVEYVCNLPLEKCLDLLKGRSERKRGILADRHKLLITINYETHDEYSFIVDRYITYGRTIRRIHIEGTLRRANTENTTVTMDSTKPQIQRTTIPVLFIAPLIPFLISLGISIAWDIKPFQIWMILLGLGILMSGAIYSSLINIENQKWGLLAAHVFEVLPPT